MQSVVVKCVLLCSICLFSILCVDLFSVTAICAAASAKCGRKLLLLSLETMYYQYQLTGCFEKHKHYHIHVFFSHCKYIYIF